MDSLAAFGGAGVKDVNGRTAVPPPPAASSVLVTNNIKIANVSSVVTQDILENLFGFLGEIRSIKLQPSRFSPDTRECIVEYADKLAVQASLHLSGTELGDRMLVVTANYNPAAVPQSPVAGAQSAPILRYSQPTAAVSHLAAMAAAGTPGFVASYPQTAAFAPPGAGAGNTPLAHAAGFYANAAAAAAAAAMAGFDPVRAEEISRTIYVGNVTGYVSEPQLLELCNTVGPVAHIKLAGAVDANTRFAFVEYTHVDDARKALSLNGTIIGDRPLKVSPSKSSINKPANIRKTADAAGVAAMQRVREAQQRIASKYGAGVAAVPAAGLGTVAPPAAGPAPALAVVLAAAPAAGPASAPASAPAFAHAPALPTSSSTSAAGADEQQSGSCRSRRHSRSGTRSRTRSRTRSGIRNRTRSRTRSRARSRTRSRSGERTRYGRSSSRRVRDRNRDRYDARYDHQSVRYSGRHCRSRSRERDYRRGKSYYGSERDREHDWRDRDWGRPHGDDYYDRDQRREEDARHGKRSRRHYSRDRGRSSRQDESERDRDAYGLRAPRDPVDTRACDGDEVASARVSASRSGSRSGNPTDDVPRDGSNTPAYEDEGERVNGRDDRSNRLRNERVGKTQSDRPENDERDGDRCGERARDESRASVSPGRRGRSPSSSPSHRERKRRSKR